MAISISKDIQRKLSRLQQVIKSRVDNYLKNVEKIPLKYTKVSINPIGNEVFAIHIKIYLLKPVRFSTLQELIKIINQIIKTSDWYVFAPHANAIRISTEFSITQVTF